MKTKTVFDNYTLREISKSLQWEDNRPKIHFHLELKNEKTGTVMSTPYSGGIAAFLTKESRARLAAGDARRNVKTSDILRGVRFRDNDTPQMRGTLADIVTASKADLKGVMYSLVMDSDADGMPFTEWAENLGYDSDSIKARGIWEACIEQTRKFKKLIGRDFQEIAAELADY